MQPDHLSKLVSIPILNILDFMCKFGHLFVTLFLNNQKGMFKLQYSIGHLLYLLVFMLVRFAYVVQFLPDAGQLILLGRDNALQSFKLGWGAHKFFLVGITSAL